MIDRAVHGLELHVVHSRVSIVHDAPAERVDRAHDRPGDEGVAIGEEVPDGRVGEGLGFCVTPPEGGVHVDADIAERFVIAQLPTQSPDLRDPVPDLVGRDLARDPAIAEPCCPALGGLGSPAEQEGRIWLLDRFWKEVDLLEVDELAVEGRTFLGPQRENGLEVQVPEVFVASGLVVLGLLMVSPIPYRSGKELDLRHSYGTLVLVIIALVLIANEPSVTLFAIGIAYCVSGPIEWLWRRAGGTPLQEIAPAPALPGEPPGGAT